MAESIERIHPEEVHPIVWSDHYHRYLLASDFCSGIVLDAACGVGYGSEIINRNSSIKHYVGVDISSEALSYFQKKFLSDKISAQQSDVQLMPFAHHCFDSVISFETIEHLENPKSFIEEIFRVLKPEGVFIGSVPSRSQEEVIDDLYGKNPYHKTRFDIKTIEDLLRSYFPYIVFFQQSLEISDFIRPYKTEPKTFRKDDNPRNPGFAFGPILFVASFHPFDEINLSGRIIISEPFYEADRSYIKHVRKIQSDLLTAQKEINDANFEVGRLNEEVENLRSEVLFLRSETDRLNNEVYSLRDEVIFLRGEVDRLNIEVDTLRGEVLYLRGEVDRLNVEVNSLRGEVLFLRDEVERLNLEVDNYRHTEKALIQDRQAKEIIITNLSEELESIKNSYSFRLMLLIKRIPGIRLLKPIFKFYQSILHKGYSVLYHPNPPKKFSSTQSSAGDSTGRDNISINEVLIVKSQGLVSRQSFNEKDQAWLSRMQQDSRPISVLHPNWLGIRSSTQQLFNELYMLDDTLDETNANYYARLFNEARIPAIIIQGFPSTYYFLVQAIKKINPDIPIYVIWHGNFMQSNEEYNWASFKLVENLCRDGSIKKWGFVKKGMAESLANRGLSTGFVMNLMKDIPNKASTPLSGGPHLGLWASSNTWRKLPYAMLAAVTDFPKANVFAAGHASPRIKEFANFMGVTLNYNENPIPQHEMPIILSQMHLNLYVTLSECTPMVPLESLSVGSPCLIGPTSHLFEDDPYLFSRLIVPFPERSEVISKYIAQALDERDNIIKAYKDYAPAYNRKARLALKEFLDGLDA